MVDENTLYQRLGKAIERFESSVDPKEKYKAESAACRIAQQVNYHSIVYGKEGAYIPAVDEKSGVLRLQKVSDLDDLARFAIARNRTATDFKLLRPSFMSGADADNFFHDLY